jgi:hypothetical protein
MKTFALALAIAFVVLGGAATLTGSNVAVACEGSGCKVALKGELGATHEKPKTEPDTRFGSCESSPALRGVAVPKPRRIVAEGAKLLERSYALPLKGE